MIYYNYLSRSFVFCFWVSSTLHCKLQAIFLHRWHQRHATQWRIKEKERRFWQQMSEYSCKNLSPLYSDEASSMSLGASQKVKLCSTDISYHNNLLNNLEIGLRVWDLSTNDVLWVQSFKVQCLTKALALWVISVQVLEQNTLNRLNLPHTILLQNLNVVSLIFHHRPFSELSFFHLHFALAEIIPNTQVKEFHLIQADLKYWHFRIYYDDLHYW